MPDFLLWYVPFLVAGLLGFQAAKLKRWSGRILLIACSSIMPVVEYAVLHWYWLKVKHADQVLVSVGTSTMVDLQLSGGLLISLVVFACMVRPSR